MLVSAVQQSEPAPRIHAPHLAGSPPHVGHHRALSSSLGDTAGAHWLPVLCAELSASVVSDSVTPWTAACQAPLSMGSSRQEYWVGCHFPLHGSARARDGTFISCIERRPQFSDSTTTTYYVILCCYTMYYVILCCYVMLCFIMLCHN